MAGLTGLLGWLVAGGIGVIWAIAGVVVLVLLNPHVSPRLILRMYRAVPLGPRLAPELVALVRELATRSGLPTPPALYYVPSKMINAFTLGRQDNASLAVTDGLLRQLPPREVTGVLAHEITHIRYNDVWAMGLSDLFSRLTSAFSTLGLLLLILNIPLYFLSENRVGWGAILTLVFAPTFSALMQLALSRVREYDADVGAAEITGDPRGLASALARMERYQGRIFEQVFLPGRGLPAPSLLRTHPSTEERIRRLLELEPDGTTDARGVELPRARQPNLPGVKRPPGWHVSGLWY